MHAIAMLFIPNLCPHFQTALQRCRDTINALEAKQAAVSASPLPSASGAGGTVAGHSP